MLAAGAANTSGPWFEDIAAQSGLTVTNIAGGVEKKAYILESTGNGGAIYDLDGDGWNEVFLTNGDRLNSAEILDKRPRLYRNNLGKLIDVTARSGIGKTGWGQGVCIGDVDNDGLPDLFLTYYGENALYRNQGGLRFEEVTAKAGLLHGEKRWGAGCSFSDYDRDGDLDLFVSNYVDFDLATAPKPGSSPNCQWKGLEVFCGPRGLDPALNRLYRNRGDGSFEDVSESAGILKPGPRYGLGVVAADFDNDGWPDFYVACDMTQSLYYRNRGDGSFEERGVEAGVALNGDGRLQSGMGVAVADYDRNGFLDIAKTNFSGDLPSLYNNEDGGFFTDVALFAGLVKHQYVGWGAAWVDADEDGWPDLMLANGHVYPEVEGSPTGERYRYPTLLYRNLGNGQFADWTAKAGPALAIERPARGLAVGDIDNDGHPEILIVNMNLPPALLRNRGPRGSWVVVRLAGSKSNRSAIGARVKVVTADGAQQQEVMSGGSFYSQHSQELYFGLGAAKTIQLLEVRWPSGAVQTFDDAPVRRRLWIEEGRDSIEKPSN